MSVESRILEIIRGALCISEPINTGLPLGDSLDRYELALQFEEAFDIDMSDAQVDPMLTVKDALEIVGDIVYMERIT